MAMLASAIDAKRVRRRTRRTDEAGVEVRRREREREEGRMASSDGGETEGKEHRQRGRERKREVVKGKEGAKENRSRDGMSSEGSRLFFAGGRKACEACERVKRGRRVSWRRRGRAGTGIRASSR
jgi:hypothetical protein